MNKTGKIVVFILMIVVLGVLGPIIKGVMVIPYYTIVGLILTFTYQGMFKKVIPSDKHETQSQVSNLYTGFTNSNGKSYSTGRNSDITKQNFKNHQPSTSSEDEAIIKELFTNLESLTKQKEALINLNRENLFTTDEFNEKMNILQQKENEIREKQHDMQIRRDAEPSIENLSSLLAADNNS